MASKGKNRRKSLLYENKWVINLIGMRASEKVWNSLPKKQAYCKIKFHHPINALTLICWYISYRGPGWLSRLSIQLSFGSGHDLTAFVGQHIRLQHGGCLGSSLSLSSCPSPTHAVSVSLKINKLKKNFFLSEHLIWSSDTLNYFFFID